MIVLAERDIFGIGVLYFLEKKETDISGRKYHVFGRKVHASLTKLAFLGENVIYFGECLYFGEKTSSFWNKWSYFGLRSDLSGSKYHAFGRALLFRGYDVIFSALVTRGKRPKPSSLQPPFRELERTRRCF